MFANPEVSAFIDRLIGGQTSRGGTPPSSAGYRDTLARSLLGDITRPSSAAIAPASAIQTSRRPIATPAPSVGVNRGIGSQEQQEGGNRASSIGTNAGALSAGIENLGRGIEGGLEGIATKQQNAAEIAALGQGGAFPKFGGGGSGAPAGTGLPSFAQQSGVSAGTPSAASGAGVTLAQFLNGIKAGEGVPYSGQSSTGAIGAYGLTGGFIKQWAPGAGLPTDRASYMNNPALQDQLAAYAATQMHNQFGSWAPVANAWLTGSPTATTSAPGNMSPSAYVDKVMRAAGAFAPPSTVPAQGAGSQAVIPGQSNPHLPGFDPSSVSFTNTPTGSQANAGAAEAPAPVGGPVQSGVYGGQPYTFQTQPALGQQGMLMPQMDPLALALAGGQMPPVDPNFGGSPSGLFG